MIKQIIFFITTFYKEKTFFQLPHYKTFALCSNDGAEIRSDKAISNDWCNTTPYFGAPFAFDLLHFALLSAINNNGAEEKLSFAI